MTTGGTPLVWGVVEGFSTRGLGFRFGEASLGEPLVISECPAGFGVVTIGPFNRTELAGPVNVAGPLPRGEDVDCGATRLCDEKLAAESTPDPVNNKRARNDRESSAIFFLPARNLRFISLRKNKAT